jgi:molybdopterin molybdotransferase
LRVKSFEQALELVIERGRLVSESLHATYPVEVVPTLQALGRVLAEDLRSEIDVPAQDNTQMDGYAVRSADIERVARQPVRVSQRIPAGAIGQPLEPGTVARIFTGAFIPQGADAVVMQEAVQIHGADGSMVSFAHAPEPGQWIRRRGEDVMRDQVVVSAGTILTPQALGLAASVGVAQIAVRPRLRVACFFTGNELVMPGEPLPAGSIYNSNRFVLVNLLKALGCEVNDLGIVKDNLDATRAALRQAAASCDVILTCGGVSVGEEDHVKPAVQAEGSLDQWQVAIKPGKPIAFGQVGQAQFVGLPGNPVSAFITFLTLVRPFLLRSQGVTGPQALQPPRLPLRAAFSWPKPDKRREFLRVRMQPDGSLALFANQGSGVLTSTVWGDGVVDNPAGQAIAFGDTVHYLPFERLGA